MLIIIKEQLQHTVWFTLLIIHGAVSEDYGAAEWSQYFLSQQTQFDIFFN